MANTQFINANPTDCGDIAAVHIASWQAAYTNVFPAEYLQSLSIVARRKAWEQVLAEAKSNLVVARKEGVLTGFVSYGPGRDSDSTARRGEIWALYVHPKVWGTGVGRDLWLRAKRDLDAHGLDEVTLWVLDANKRAISFYERAGFTRDKYPPVAIERGGTQVAEIRMMLPSTR